jgi:4-hydroxy-tetrahydrodipicolinate synthase
VSCPIVVYNIPGRSVVDVLPDTIEELCRRAENVVSVKEASGNVLRTQTLVRRLGDRISVLSGDDALTLPIMASGGRGVISVTSNILPAEVSRVVSLALQGKWEEARALHLSLLDLHEAMFLEPSPAPVKAGLALERHMGDGVRGPLVAASEATRAAIAEALAELRR